MPLDPLFAHEPVVLASALTLGALLLWLGATLGAEARSRAKPLSSALLATSTVLVASGLWWPGHLMPGDGTLTAQRDISSALAWLLALALAGMAQATAAALARRALPAAATAGIATLVNGAPLGPFWATFFTNASTTDLWGSVLKCTGFGAIIAVVCCYKGMTASGGAEGVGRAVNQAVVIATLGVFAFNYVFTQTLLATHPEITVIK